MSLAKESWKLGQPRFIDDGEDAIFIEFPDRTVKYVPERKGRNLEGNDGKTRCSECGTLVVDMAYFDELGGGVVLVRNYPDYCPKCGVRLEG